MLGLGLGLNKWRRVGGFVGLLDLFPNAAAAYSLRKLRAAYSGSAVRVRKEVSTVSSETDIGFLADGSLDTTSLLAFASDADGGDVFVVTWYDQSANNRDRVQAVAANQPMIVDSGVVTLDPDTLKPAIKFDFTETLDSSSFVLSQPTTKFLIGHSTNSSRNQIFSGSLDSNARNQITYLTSNGGQLSLFAGITFNPSNATTEGLLNNTWLAYALFNGTSSELGVNGNTASVGDAGVFNNDGLSTGTTASIVGYLSEEVFYGDDQSANRTGIETNINTFYSIYP